MDPRCPCKSFCCLEQSTSVKYKSCFRPFKIFYCLLYFSENAGLLALTRVGSRRVVQISAGFMIFFSILGKFLSDFSALFSPNS